MAYASQNFKSKKALKEAVAAGEEVTIWSYAGIFPTKTDGATTLEGPWNPQPHSWYAAVTMVDGKVVKVK